VAERMRVPARRQQRTHQWVRRRMCCRQLAAALPCLSCVGTRTVDPARGQM